MAGSRRRLKKTRPVVSMKKRKKPHTLAKVPKEITAGRPSIAEKLGVECAAPCAPAERKQTAALRQVQLLTSASVPGRAGTVRRRW